MSRPFLGDMGTTELWGRSFVGTRHSQVSQLQRDLGHPLLKLGFVRRLEGVGTPGSRNIGETPGHPPLLVNFGSCTPSVPAMTVRLLPGCKGGVNAVCRFFHS